MRPGPAPVDAAVAVSLLVPAGTVVIDTDVWSHIYLTSGAGSKNAQRVAERHALIDALTGKTVVIALQTRAELLTFPLVRQLGERRTAEVLTKMDQTPTVPVTEEVVTAWARLTAACRASNHPLGFKEHASDRWIAATAIALGVPLLAADGGYKDAPGLTLLSR